MATTITIFYIIVIILCILWMQGKTDGATVGLVLAFVVPCSAFMPVRGEIELLDLSGVVIVEYNGKKYGSPHKSYRKKDGQDGLLILEPLEKKPKGVIKEDKYSFFGFHLKTEYSFSY